MKIALIGPTLTSACREALGLRLDGAPPGTAQTPIAPLAASLRAAGHQVHILTLEPTIDQTVTVEEDGFTLTFCPLRGPPKHRARVRSLDMFEQEIRELTAALKALAPDIVHAHWTYEFAEAAVRSDLPHVVTMHDLGWQILAAFRDAYRAMRLLMKYRVMPRVRALTVVAPFMVTKARTYGYFGPVDIVSNGVEIPAPDTLRDKLSSVCTAPVFATIGDDGPIKNVGAAVRAFEIIRASRPQATLHLFGPGLNEAFAAGRAGVTGHDSVPHAVLMDFLAQKATVLLHPSRIETFGVIIAEAKARGVPVVAGSRSGGVGHVCDDGVSRLVDIDDPAAIAAATLALTATREVYKAASGASRRDIVNRFSTEGVAALYEAIYKRLLSVGEAHKI